MTNKFLRLNTYNPLLFGSLDSLDLKIPPGLDLVKSLMKHKEVAEHFRDLLFSIYLISLRENDKNLHVSACSDRILVQAPNKSYSIMDDLIPGSHG